MKVTVIGTGYVGLVSGACFAEMGTRVVCVDVDAAKIERLKKGEIPIYEPGLEDIVVRNSSAGRLRFTTSLAEGLEGADVVFIAVGTPPDEDGSADLSHVLGVAREIGQTMTGPLVVVTKSTVPVGTTDRVREIIADQLEARGVGGCGCGDRCAHTIDGNNCANVIDCEGARTISFDVANNPEFLKEGNAVEDFMHPDRVVVGVASEGARSVMERLYKPFMINSPRLIFTDIRSSEMIKYAANAMLATRISFMNDIANLCELVGADVSQVRRGIGTDPRIGSKFLYAGLGYGGSCFPKDVNALMHTAGQHGYRLEILEAVENVNRRQKEVLVGKVRRAFGDDLSGRTFGVWGLAFKPETDDVRASPALVVVGELLRLGAVVRGYDPAAMETARVVLGDRVTYCETMYEAAEGADALLVVTEWKQFRLPDWDAVRSVMKGAAIYDGRNIYDPAELRARGFTYEGIGV